MPSTRGRAGAHNGVVARASVPREITHTTLMREGASWFGIAGIASLLCGLLVAATAGEASAGRGSAALVIVVATAIGVGLVARSGRRHPGGTRRRSSASEPSPAAAARAYDVDAVRSLTEILWQADIEWVSYETFRAPWRCNRIASFRLLLESEDRLVLPTDPAVSMAFTATTAAVRSFVALYDSSTSPDPLTRAGDWQEVLGAKAGERGETERREFEFRCTELSRLGREVARCYEQLIAFA